MQLININNTSHYTNIVYCRLFIFYFTLNDICIVLKRDQVVAYSLHQNVKSVLSFNIFSFSVEHVYRQIILKYSNICRCSQTCLKGYFYVTNSTAHKGHIFRVIWVPFIYSFDCIMFFQKIREV